MLKCKICSYENEKSILSHVRNEHKMEAKEYRKRYPDSPLRLAWVNSSEESMEKFRKIGGNNAVLMKDKPSHAALPKEKWSRFYERCLQCGTTKRKHQARGICILCHANNFQLNKTATSNALKQLEGREGIDFIICKICQKPFENLTTNGHLKTHQITAPEYVERYPDALTKCEISTKRRSDGVKQGRANLLNKRGFLNPPSQRLKKSKEMSKRHAEHDFVKISMPEKQTANWFIVHGYYVSLGETTPPSESTNMIFWQHNLFNKFCVDFAFYPKKIVVEVLGDYWHAWDLLTDKKSFDDLHPAVKRNVVLDKKRFQEIEASGWTLIKIWEHEIKDGSYLKILEDHFPTLEPRVEYRTAEELVSKVINDAPFVHLHDIIKTNQEMWNARWFISVGEVQKLSKSTIERNEAIKLRHLLDTIGEKSAVPNEIIETEFIKARSEGFPYYQLNNEEMFSIWNNLQKSNEKSDVKAWAGYGTNLASFFHPHLFECYKPGKLSPKLFFDSETDLKRGIEKALCLYGKITRSNLREICRNESLSSRINNFPPLVAKDIIKEIFGTNPITILDPCAGFSGRLVGSAASGIVQSYTGIDISSETCNGLNSTYEFLQSAFCSMKCYIIEDDCLKAMNNVEKQFDFIFTSPPHLDIEIYKNITPPTLYRQWLEQFIEPLLLLSKKRLKENGRIAMYLEKIHGKNFPSDVSAIAQKIGLIPYSPILFKMSYGENQRSVQPDRMIEIKVWG